MTADDNADDFPFIACYFAYVVAYFPGGKLFHGSVQDREQTDQERTALEHLEKEVGRGFRPCVATPHQIACEPVAAFNEHRLVEQSANPESRKALPAPRQPSVQVFAYWQLLAPQALECLL